jgi:hypothetical protein
MPLGMRPCRLLFEFDYLCADLMVAAVTQPRAVPYTDRWTVDVTIPVLLSIF